MISTGEAKAQRRITAAFIAADPIDVALTRPVWVDDGAGGKVEGAPATLPPQRFRLIPQMDAGQFRMTADGVKVQPSYRLIGMHDADQQRGDRFMLDGARYEVVFVAANQDYKTKGEVAYLG